MREGGSAPRRRRCHRPPRQPPAQRGEQQTRVERGRCPGLHRTPSVAGPTTLHRHSRTRVGSSAPRRRRCRRCRRPSRQPPAQRGSSKRASTRWQSWSTDQPHVAWSTPTFINPNPAARGPRCARTTCEQPAAHQLHVSVAHPAHKDWLHFAQVLPAHGAKSRHNTRA